MADYKNINIRNKRATFDYEILEEYIAGVVLYGTEIKSIRNGSVNLKESWADVQNGEIFVYGMHISPYERGNIFNKDPLRVRKLLMHKREIMRLCGQVEQKGLTLVPLSLYFSGKNVKVELGLCRGKKLYDKRAEAAKKAANRDIERAIKEQNRYRSPLTYYFKIPRTFLVKSEEVIGNK